MYVPHIINVYRIILTMFVFLKQTKNVIQHISNIFLHFKNSKFTQIDNDKYFYTHFKF